jgi:uncharacterized repeat protein (TIGR03843 family)
MPAGVPAWWTLAGDSLTEPDALSLLLDGAVEVKGRLVTASNTTLYALVQGGGTTAACVYKPVAGERPLWDFPDGTLAGREVAAYRVSVAGGFDVVPPTVLRDGPFGLGSLQLWVEPEAATDGAMANDTDENADDSDDDWDELDDDEEVSSAASAMVTAGESTAGLVDVVARNAVQKGWLEVLEAYGVDGEPVALVHADDERLATIATFDVLVNNADRKAGHLLAAPGGRVVGVDHGLTFHAEPKLRTVLWGFAGRPVQPPDLERVRRLGRWLEDDDSQAALAGLISRREVATLQTRVRRLLRRPVLPTADSFRPAIPWPPF